MTFFNQDILYFTELTFFGPNIMGGRSGGTWAWVGGVGVGSVGKLVLGGWGWGVLDLGGVIQEIFHNFSSQTACSDGKKNIQITKIT